MPTEKFDGLLKTYQDTLYDYFSIDKNKRRELHLLRSDMAQHFAQSDSRSLSSSDDPLPEGEQLAIDFSVTPWEYYFTELTVDPEDLTQSARELAIQKLRDTSAEYIKLISFIKYNKDYFVSYDEYINDENALVDGESPYKAMQNLFTDLNNYFAQTGSSSTVKNGEINFKGKTYDLKVLSEDQDIGKKGLLGLITDLQTHLTTLPTRSNPKYTAFYEAFDDLNAKGLLNGSGAIFSVTSNQGDTNLYGIKDFAKGRVWEAGYLSSFIPYGNNITPPETYKNLISSKIDTLNFYQIYNLFAKDQQPFYYQISFAIDKNGKVFLRQLPARYGNVTQDIAANLKASPVKFEAIEDPTGLMPKYKLVIESLDNNKKVVFYKSASGIPNSILPNYEQLANFCAQNYTLFSNGTHYWFGCAQGYSVSSYPVLAEVDKSISKEASEIIIAPLTTTFFNNAIQESKYIISDKTAYDNVMNTPMRIYFDTQSPF
ncbi:hypothetical protein GCM10010995_02660 [Cysteiniphilum litorale]|uniref:Uncharacterized protein n=1 Tax=Cysteiniphilum litorale TaxID=2056700 RepID=A0A8J3E871_9GAMM|nr:hypothetical protein GCM10010995_02660 [Cysteiniphilum litorale]